MMGLSYGALLRGRLAAAVGALITWQAFGVAGLLLVLQPVYSVYEVW